MERKHTGKIIGLLALIFVSSFGSNIETLLQVNVEYEEAGGYAFLYSLLGLCGSAFIAMIIPLVCRLVKGAKLTHKKGKLLCVANSIVALIISAILQEFFDILFVGGIGAILYYFINKWLFVASKEEQASEKPAIKTVENGAAQMSLSFPDEKRVQHGNYSFRAEDIRLDQSITPVQVSKTTPISPPTTVNPSTAVQKKNVKYCSSCGNVIDSNTKKCNGCGKQYFNGMPWKIIFIVLLAICLVLSIGCNAFLYIANSDLQQEVASLDKSLEHYKNLASTYKEDKEKYFGFWTDALNEIAFYAEFVVFVEDDGTNLYHKYDCSKFKGEGFWAFNIDTAIDEGYTPCPLCCD